jgi:hypothetical protein
MTRAPRWVPAIILGVGALPLIIALLQPEPGFVSGDNPHHLVAMRALANGFESPYATCQAPLGQASWRYFAPPIFLLYAGAGELCRMAGLPEWAWLPVCHSLGGLLYLWMLWRFLRTAAPALAPRAFLLLTLGGGLGGVAYVYAYWIGATTQPGFEQVFQRFAWYELIEGQHLRPDLIFHRLYYTLALAAGYAALTAWLETLRSGCLRHLGFAAFLMALCALLNVRLGIPMTAVGLLFTWRSPDYPAPLRRRCSAVLLLALGLGSAASLALIAQHPVYAENVRAITADAMRLFPFLTQAGFLLVLAALGLRGVTTGHRGLPILMHGLVGYLAVFIALYFGHQAYYGNFLYGGEGRALSIRVSDYAGLGAVAGLLVGWGRQGRANPAAPRDGVDALPPWIALWLLIFLSAALSAWGQGTWLATSPQRLMVLLGPPLALAAAAGVARLSPRIQGLAVRAIVVLGVASVLVSALYFQGPYAKLSGSRAFAYLRYDRLDRLDQLLARNLDAGTYLVPTWNPIAAGELLVQYPGIRVLGGPGAMNLGDQPLARIQGEVDAFFQPGQTRARRNQIVRDWCVDFVLATQTAPLPRPLREELAAWAAGEGLVHALDHDRLWIDTRPLKERAIATR